MPLLSARLYDLGMAGLKYPLVELFTELDRLHFGGRLTAAGWRVKAYGFNYRDEDEGTLRGRCETSSRRILISRGH